ncbi:MAG: hypothetical protein IPM91_02370 [Bacteroidetes bacterium]|nr:hypothetical protein [Bacteroidota bacterium]
MKQIVEESGLNLNSLESINMELDKIKIAVERAVSITDDEYTLALGTVANREVKFQRLYDNNYKEIGYKVSYNGRLIVEYKHFTKKNKYKKHFGYQVFKEIIDANGRILKAKEFSFFSEVESVLSKIGSSNDENNDESSNYDVNLKSIQGSSFTKELVSSVDCMRELLHSDSIDENNLTYLELSKFEERAGRNYDYYLKDVSKLKRVLTNRKKG